MRFKCPVAQLLVATALVLTSKCHGRRLPMCDKRGVCGESPELPSPRTEYSAKSSTQREMWHGFHKELQREAFAFATRKPYPGPRRSVVFLGDSIFETLRGTDLGMKSEREYLNGTANMLEALATMNKFDPLILAIGGDQTQHLLFRLMNGELNFTLPYGKNPLRDDATAIYLLHIGTNNLGAGFTEEQTSRGILAVVRWLLENTSGRVVVLGLLPRGDGFKLVKKCPTRCDSNGKPFKSFLPAIRKVNDALSSTLASSKWATHEGRLSFVDCGAEFTRSPSLGEEVDSSMMPDLLHPNVGGHLAIAKCLMEMGALRKVKKKERGEKPKRRAS